MDESLNRPTWTEGESSDKPKMRVAKLRDLEEIYACIPKCIITDVEKMSQETHASANTNWHKQKSSHEDHPSGKCKGKNERSLSSDKKVSKSQNSSQFGKLGASETVKSRKENNVRAAPKKTSTNKEHPSSSFPHQKKQGCPTTRKKNHSLKGTTNKEVKTNNLLLNQNVIEETKNEEGCFRRLRMLGSSKKIRSSKKAGVEGGNESACDLDDSDYLLVENVDVTRGCGSKRARSRLILETSSDDEKAPDSCEKKKKKKRYRVSGEAQVTENELNGRKKGRSILLRDHMNEAHKSSYRKDDKCSSWTSKKPTAQRSVWNKYGKSVITPANLYGTHEATKEIDDTHVDATRNKDGKLPELESHEEFIFLPKNTQKNVSFVEEMTCKKGDSTRTLVCLEGDKKSKKIKGKEKVSSRDERVAGKSNKTRFQKEGGLRLANNRVPRRATDDHNSRFSNVLNESQYIIKRELKKPMSDTSKSFSESTTPEGNEFEAHNWKSSPPFVISQKTNLGSSKILSQIPDKTSLTASRMNVSSDYGHLGSYSPLSAIHIHSSTAAMLKNFELQETEGVSKTIYPSQVLTDRHVTGFKDKMELCLRAKNSMHNISQAKSHAAESTRTGRLRLLGKDIELDADEIGEPKTSRSTGSHNITMENIFGPNKPSDGVVSPRNNMARLTQSLSIGLGSRLKDSMVSQMMVHNNPGTTVVDIHLSRLFMNNGLSGCSLPPEIAATYMNSFGRSTAPLVPNNFWGNANPSYYQHQVTLQSMAAASPPTPYAPPPNGEATRNKSIPKPLNSGVPESSYLSPLARGHLVPISSSAPRASKPAPRRCNHPSLF